MANIFDLFKQIEAKPQASITHLVVGLGNPESKYTYTRHNAGFLAIDYLCSKIGAKCDRLKFKALIGEATIGGVRVLLMKPQTYMNLSGEAVIEASSFYKIPPENIIVLSDDTSLDVGRMRIRKSGSAGGHNGLKNIIEHLKTDTFPRIKLGVGQKPPHYDMVDWVLGRLTEDDEKKQIEIIKLVPDALELMLKGEVEKAMCDYNGVIK
ncbi:MAG: aminoacyl-tRNA hydrolase [Clostridia bacterium]|nr:aminoacyl-tRNA hydrolase [Clostridia bacterium]